MIQTLIIDNYHPLSVNKLLETDPRKRSAMKQSHYDIVGGLAMQQGLVKATGKRRMTILCEGWPRGKMPDPSNLAKVLEDAAVACGLLIDDSSKWCESTMPVLKRSKQWRTTLTFEDINE